MSYVEIKNGTVQGLWQGEHGSGLDYEQKVGERPDIDR